MQIPVTMNTNVGITGLTAIDDIYTIDNDTHYTDWVNVQDSLNKSIFISVSDKTAGNIVCQLQFSHDGVTAFDADGTNTFTISANGDYVYTSMSNSLSLPPLGDYTPFMRLKIVSAPTTAGIKIKFVGIDA